MLRKVKMKRKIKIIRNLIGNTHLDDIIGPPAAPFVQIKGNRVQQFHLVAILRVRLGKFVDLLRIVSTDSEIRQVTIHVSTSLSSLPWSN